MVPAAFTVIPVKPQVNLASVAIEVLLPLGTIFSLPTPLLEPAT